MQVLRFHCARPALTVADALVKQMALRIDTGAATRDDLVLEE